MAYRALLRKRQAWRRDPLASKGIPFPVPERADTELDEEGLQFKAIATHHPRSKKPTRVGRRSAGVQIVAAILIPYRVGKVDGNEPAAAYSAIPAGTEAEAMVAAGYGQRVRQRRRQQAKPDEDAEVVAAQITANARTGVGTADPCGEPAV